MSKNEKGYPAGSEVGRASLSPNVMKRKREEESKKVERAMGRLWGGEMRTAGPKRDEAETQWPRRRVKRRRMTAWRERSGAAARMVRTLGRERGDGPRPRRPGWRCDGVPAPICLDWGISLTRLTTWVGGENREATVRMSGAHETAAEGVGRVTIRVTGN